MAKDFGEVSFIGQLSDIPVGELLYSLKAQKESGLLYFRKDKIVKKLFFQMGLLIQVESSLSRESLLRYCLQESKIDLDHFNEGLNLTIESNSSPEAILTEKSILSSNELSECLLSVMRDRIIDIFSWDDGQYAFFFDSSPDNILGTSTISFSIDQIVYQGIRSGYSKSKLNSFIIDELEETWALTIEFSEIQRRLNLRSPEVQIVRQIDGKKKVEQIIFLSKMNMRSTLALLIALKTLRFALPIEILQLEDKPKLPLDIQLDPNEKIYAHRLINSGPALLDLPPFELLQVGRKFTDTDLRKGYYQLAQRYHQKETTNKLPLELKELSSRIFDRISLFFEALLTIEKAVRDNTYQEISELNEITFGERIDFYKGIERFMEGKKLFEDKLYKLAENPLSEATELSPYEGEYRTLKAICNYRLHSDGDNEIIRNTIQELRKSLSLDSDSIPTKLYIAQLEEKLDHIEKSYGIYRDILFIDSNNEEALKGIGRTKPSFTLATEDQHTENLEEALKIENKLRGFLENTKKMNYFEILGLDQKATAGKIKHAYFKLAKEFHPDRMGSLKNHPLAEEVFLKINSAYDILSSDNKRRFYERSLRSKEREIEFIHSQKRLNTEKMFAKASAFLNDNLYDKAFKLFEEIDSSKNGCPQCKAHLGYSLFMRDYKSNPRIAQEAERYFEESLKLDENYTEAYVLWGKMYRILENYKKAYRYFKKALEENPENLEALREIRLISARKKQIEQKEKASEISDEGKTGLFGSLFGKKKS